MASHLVQSESVGDSATGPIPGRGEYTFLECAMMVFAVCAHAQAAAWRYEELARLSDQELLARGLERADLPRAAFRLLVEGAEALR